MPSIETVALPANCCPDLASHDHYLAGQMERAFTVLGRLPSKGAEVAKLNNRIILRYPDSQSAMPYFKLLKQYYVIVRCNSCGLLTFHVNTGHGWRTIAPCGWRRRVQWVWSSAIPIEDHSLDTLQDVVFSWNTRKLFQRIEHTQRMGFSIASENDEINPCRWDYCMLLEKYFSTATEADFLYTWNQLRESLARHLPKKVLEFHQEFVHQKATSAALYREVAQHLYDNQRRGQKSIEDRELRIKLAQAAQAAGADVPPELLVDRSSKKTSSSAPAQVETKEPEVSTS